MVSPTDLDRFYENLVQTIQSSGVACAITSGMACVRYGVAISTKDCDILCSADSSDQLFDLLKTKTFLGASCSYRGHITAPLESRWQRGGWTAHFEWKVDSSAAYLDVFGVAPRASTPWEAECSELLAGMHTVAEMKRTDRAKDWPFATALGVKMIEAGDLRGWLHIFEIDTLRDIILRVPCPNDIVAHRPALKLLLDHDPRLKSAVHCEMVFWHELDRIRLKIHDTAVRTYFRAVKSDPRLPSNDLAIQHRVRVEHAGSLLPTCPIREYGIERLIAEAREATSQLVNPDSLAWLPDVTPNFVGLR
ncbi:MAG: hypothetical protein ABL921_26295 [Pirellula sp.]